MKRKKIKYCVWIRLKSFVGMSEFGHKIEKEHKDALGEFDYYEDAQNFIDAQEFDESEEFWEHEFWIEKVWVFANEN